jgi:uncharacterized SAM-binding protein YcdF (DUF218 family)
MDATTAHKNKGKTATGIRDTATQNNVERIGEALDSGARVVLLVFGKKLRRDGTLDHRGIATVNKVEELYKEIHRKVEGRTEGLTILLTGGKSSSYVLRGVEVPTEAETMKRELVPRGVSEDRIILEEGSYDTVGNVILSFPKIRAIDANKVVLIAEEPMMDRALKITRKVFGSSYELIPEPAGVKLSAPYKLYNKQKEWLAFKLLFERNFGGIEEGDVEGFMHRLNQRHLYKRAGSE